MLLALVQHFFRLDQVGFANLYYAATVQSMLTSWHNFFYASFDAGGFATVDKPPLGLWVQATSAFVFGFNGFSLLLPQALAGVLSVALLYHLVARVFGAGAGLVAARTRWYGRIVHLALTTIVLVVVSFAWIAVFDLTPADERPYAGGSRNNTMMELVVGHNGVTRLGAIAEWLGLRRAPPARSAQPPPGQVPRPQNPPPPPPSNPPDSPNAPAPMSETGAPEILCLFNQQLAGQISWLLPLAQAHLYCRMKRNFTPVILQPFGNVQVTPCVNPPSVPRPLGLLSSILPDTLPGR